MNLTDLKRRVWAQLRDTQHAYADDGTVEDWLNDGYVDLAARLQILQYETSDVTDDVVIPVPFHDTAPGDPEPVQILSLRLGDDDVEFVDDITFNNWKDDGATPPHTLGRWWNRAIELYPVPATGTAFTLRYSFLPEPMDAVEAEPELPTHLHIKLVYYALAQAKLKYGEPDEAQTWLAMYEQALPPPIRGLVTQRPAPWSLQPEGNVFDTDFEARHL